MAEMASVGGFASSNCAVGCQHEYPEHARHLLLTYRHFDEVSGKCGFMYEIVSRVPRWGALREVGVFHAPRFCSSSSTIFTAGVRGEIGCMAVMSATTKSAVVKEYSIIEFTG